MAKVGEPIDEINRLMDDQEDDFKKQFLFLVGYINRNITLQLLQEQLQRGEFEEAINIIEDRAEIRFRRAIGNTFRETVKSTNKFLKDNLNIIVDFDAVNDRALTKSTENKLRMVREFTNDHRESFSRIVRTGHETGENPRVTARKMRDSLSLTAKQSQYVENYRIQLEQGVSVDQLNQRALHDRRFNRTIQNAIDEGRPLTNQQINKMVDRYHMRFINYRAEVISRTESLNNVNLAKQTAYEEVLANGDVSSNQMSKKWHTSIDGRQRESHASINGEEVGFYEVFTTGLGNTLAYPHESGAPAEETINCRCFVQRIINLIE